MMKLSVMAVRCPSLAEPRQPREQLNTKVKRESYESNDNKANVN